MFNFDPTDQPTDQHLLQLPTDPHPLQQPIDPHPPPQPNNNLPFLNNHTIIYIYPNNQLTHIHNQ
ncbi:hypothetical protein DDB_G0267946 [Dictyostelium discoideum AX4]|uniref:Putative uncharacterized protein DDB_G0267946 n=1 Tax=Dictyostelium discoideum TaxID=44689 RepID=Y9667_DICDI|nr:hypothetical protein DDB_G0267946 [Dictyostelium discoideum AX4]Q55FU5.1 RecName: Full=Putative uncharacterized protein DDB_G0267946 [Dictyostelium discoideum]EAL73426.1 hypothetical protein DDB_G0267946 [Dictyostelium discoideum AX4]|eukprot:XP_647438.1 hypothetical protein DDB_G0267946 [Dictyostelium discoideum AX4]